jgi:hypothetical protein
LEKDKKIGKRWKKVKRWKNKVEKNFEQKLESWAIFSIVEKTALAQILDLTLMSLCQTNL